MTKPPLGLMPKGIYETQVNIDRICMIIEAMKRYSEADKPIPSLWIKELEERILEIAQ